MIGAIMIALGVTAFAVEGIRNDFQNSERKEIARREGREWYIDHKGKTKCLKDDKSAFLTTMRINGSNHKVLKYAGTNIIITDYTQQYFDKLSKESYELAQRIGASVYLYEKGDRSIKENDIPGDKVKDIKTGEIYAIRHYGFGTLDFYVNINTGKLVRPSDQAILSFMDVKKNNPRYRECPIGTVESMKYLIKHRNNGEDTKELLQRNLFGREVYPGSYDFLNKDSLSMKTIEKCGIDKIYKEGQTWEEILKDYEDVGIDHRYYSFGKY